MLGRKGQVARGSRRARRLPRVGVPSLRLGVQRAGGGGWSAYGMGSRVVERRYGTGEMGLWGVLRRALREGLGVGVRGALE